MPLGSHRLIAAAAAMALPAATTVGCTHWKTQSVTPREAVAIRRFDPLGTAALTLGTAAVGAVAVIGAMWSERAD